MDSERIPRPTQAGLRGQHVPSSAGSASELQSIDIFLAWNPALRNCTMVRRHARTYGAEACPHIWCRELQIL